MVSLNAYILDEPFKRGLVPSETAAIGEPFLSAAYGVRATPSGLLAERSIATPYSGYAVSWPYPQLFVGKSGAFLLEEAAIHTVDTSTTPWTVSSALTLYNAENPVNTVTPATGGGPWHFLDMGPTWVFTNSKNCIFFLSGNPYVAGTKVLCAKNYYPCCGAIHGGRALFGNLTGWPASWTAFWDALIDNPPAGFTAEFDGDENTVAWSTIGDATFLWQLLLGPTYWDSDDVLYQWRRNECGFFPMSGFGGIHTIKPLGQGVMVYGNNGIAALPMSNEQATYGRIDLAGFGVKAVGGNDHQHIFLDLTGQLWAVGPDFALKPLGYKSYLSYLLEHDYVLITHNPQDNEFWISDQTNAYLLNANGLTKAVQKPTSLAWTTDGLVGAFTEMVTTTKAIETNRTDLGTVAAKHIVAAEIGALYPSDFTLNFHFRNHRDGDWRVRENIPVGKDGYVPIHTTCLEFKIDLRWPDDTQTDLQYIKVLYDPEAKPSLADISGG